MKIGLAGAAAALALAAIPAAARIVQIDVQRTEPFAEGKPFGTRGAYIKIVGVAKGELDPRDPRNRVIANLDKAPRNARGMVEYEVDFYIMRPADMTKGNGRILYEVNNRGRKFLGPWLHDARQTSPGAINEPATLEHAGNGLAFREGYTVVWSGWDPDAPRANAGLSIRVPVATDQGKPIVATIREELVLQTRGPGDGATMRLSYDAATLEKSGARLTVRARESDPPQEVPTDRWAFVDARTVKLLPEGTKFRQGWLYDFRYPAKDPKVLGIGYAATRDVVSFLRYDARDRAGNRNPLATDDGNRVVKHALAIGISQSGRYLRDHISQGFNQDEGQRKVFDGVLAHISGVGRVFFNEPFGQPGRTNTQHEDRLFPENAFPFSTAAMKDPVTGRSGSLFRHDGFDPLLIEVNTSTEYWQKGASLLTTDTLGTRDVELPKNARVYLIAGTQHGGRANLTTASGPCINPRNPNSAAPVLRALLVALDQWVSAGIEPPPSRIPTLGDGTLVPPAKTGFPAIPDVAVATFGNEIVLFGDWKDPKPRSDKVYRPLVSRVDADGNEVAGVRLPDIAVPVATYTGWNLYKAPFPEGELCDRDGSFLAFAKTRAEREARKDPRPSIEERYASHAEYASRVAAAAQQLVRERLLLAEDAARYVGRAQATNPLQ
jgi:hypothetical protein